MDSVISVSLISKLPVKSTSTSQNSRFETLNYLVSSLGSNGQILKTLGPVQKIEESRSKIVHIQLL